jgi:hypothetical protein
MASAAATQYTSPDSNVVLKCEDPTVQGYGGEGANVICATQAPSKHVDDGIGGLPFTGFDVGILFLGAVLLIAVGYAMRRSVRA